MALSYATFAIFQILTLLVSGQNINTGFVEVGLYVFVGVAVFILTEQFIYMELNNRNYSKYFAAFLFFSGILLVVKSMQ